MTFVNAKRELKVEPIANNNLEFEDPSLFKRLQYAKEVLVQMMSGGSTLSQQSTFQQVLHQAASHRGSLSPSERN